MSYGEANESFRHAGARKGCCRKAGMVACRLECAVGRRDEIRGAGEDCFCAAGSFVQRLRKCEGKTDRTSPISRPLNPPRAPAPPLPADLCRALPHVPPSSPAPPSRSRPALPSSPLPRTPPVLVSSSSRALPCSRHHFLLPARVARLHTACACPAGTQAQRWSRRCCRGARRSHRCAAACICRRSRE